MAINGVLTGRQQGYVPGQSISQNITEVVASGISVIGGVGFGQRAEIAIDRLVTGSTASTIKFQATRSPNIPEANFTGRSVTLTTLNSITPIELYDPTGGGFLVAARQSYASHDDVVASIYPVEAGPGVANAPPLVVAQSEQKESSATSIVIDKPVGTLANDLLVAFISAGSGVDQVTTVPANWTLIGSGLTPAHPTIRAYYVIASGTEPANYTWGASETERWAGVVTTLRLNNGTNSTNADDFGVFGTSPQMYGAMSGTTTTLSDYADLEGQIANMAEDSRPGDMRQVQLMLCCFATYGGNIGPNPIFISVFSSADLTNNKLSASDTTGNEEMAVGAFLTCEPTVQPSAFSIQTSNTPLAPFSWQGVTLLLGKGK